MADSNELQQSRTLTELRGFIKKLLYDPSILETSLSITREHLGESDAAARIADAISANTSINIPSQQELQSPGDIMFLALLKEVIEEDQGLY